MKHRLLTALIAIAALALAATPAALADNPNKDKDTYVQLLAINDFHGHVRSRRPRTVDSGDDPDWPNEEPDDGRVVNQTGTQAAPSTSRHKVKKLRMDNTNTMFVGIRRPVGASPLTSALFHDEPTVEALNMMGLDV